MNIFDYTTGVWMSIEHNSSEKFKEMREEIFRKQKAASEWFLMPD